EKNIWLTRGLIFSEKVLLRLVDKGLSREKAYGLVQRNAMKSWKEKEDFRDLILNDGEIKSCLSAEEIGECFDTSHDLTNVDYIFNRVFSE
ncbi:MAG TPA: adenylosuccinate lyase, partial [Thermodesulfobacteriota bacterium]|nr:adenylosuccinate lyase [Thermodesulfobacteriota bacterium]